MTSREARTAAKRSGRLHFAVAPRSQSRYASGKQERRSAVEFFSFDREYVRRLSEGDAEVERHFVDYFASLLLIKLRSRLRSRQDIEDVRQEVFLRVIRSVRSERGLHEPERLGAFVLAVCNNVLLEHFRHQGRVTQIDSQTPEPRQPRADFEQELVTEENQQYVRDLIDELSAKDRGILRAVFLEERDKDAVCREFGIRREYLRVLLHRAKNRFRQLLAGGKSLAAQGAGSSTGYSQ